MLTPTRLDEIRQIVQAGERGAITIIPSLRVAAVELLAALDDAINGRATLRCNDVRLELLATTPPEAHAAIDALFSRIEIPVGPMYERDRLRAEVERLTPKWQEGEPPFGQVLRDEDGEAMAVDVTTEGTYYRFGILYDEPWGEARWAHIPKPTEG